MPILNLNTTSSRNTYFDIARGLRPDCTPIHLFGFNRTIETAYETVWNNGGGIYTFPASATQLSLESSSASDTMDVQITGLDADRNILVETITLNGTTAVTTTGSFLRINDARITSGNNVGNIDIYADETTYAYIEATYGVHQAAIYSTPSTHSLYITQIDFTSGTLTSNKYMAARACLRNGYELHFFETTFVTSQLTYNLQQPFKIPAGHDFTLEGKSSAQTNELSIYIAGVLMED